MELAYDVSNDLEGTLNFKYIGIQSTKDKLEDRIKEIAEFYTTGYKEDSAKIVQSLGLSEAQVEFYDKSDTSCSVTLKAKFDNFIHALLAEPVFGPDDTDYTIRKEDDRFYVTLSAGFFDDDDVPFTFSVKYDGVIVEHNASVFDEEANRMVWEGGKITPPGIYFVLEL
jgi:hypothetical protein